MSDIFAEKSSVISSVAEPDPFVLGLLDPDTDPSVSGEDPFLDPDPDPSVIKQK